MIVVTGATGQLGSAVVERLLERVPADQLGVSVRSPQHAGALAARGVRVRRGDFDDPTSLRDAFEGANQVLVVSGNATGEAAVQQHVTAIDAARAVGVERIVYTSHMGASPTSLFAPMPDHAATEAALEASGLAFTSLRNGFYAASALMLMGPAVQTGQLVAPEDGPVSWTTHADLAEVAAIALAEPGRLDGLTPPLTAGRAVDFAELAVIASEVSGASITRVTVSDDEWRANMRAHGMPDAVVDLLLGVFLASRRGEFSAVDPTLEDLLGRAPSTMREVLRDDAA
jgi:uncharacterized protein YbjT (DUF2867 family)